MNPTLLTDINIETVVGQLRGILQKQAQQIEQDMEANGNESIQLTVNLTISKEKAHGYTGNMAMQMEYVPVVRKASCRRRFEDVRQGSMKL